MAYFAWGPLSLLALITLCGAESVQTSSLPPFPSPKPGSACQSCSNEYRPTCCEFPDSTRTMGSLCACSCFGGTPRTFGDQACPGEEPDCSAITSQVCCQTSSNKIETAADGCSCEEEGGTILSKAACPVSNVCESIRCRGSFLCSEGSAIRGEGPTCNQIACDCFFDTEDATKEVCCASRGALNTVSGRCSCEFCGLGGVVLFEGACPAKPPCVAGPEVDPVCCKRSTGALFEAVNEEACACEDGVVLNPGRCSEDGPVCTGQECPNEEVCIVRGGVATCVIPSKSCSTVICSTGETCIESDDGPVCSTATPSPSTSVEPVQPTNGSCY